MKRIFLTAIMAATFAYSGIVLGYKNDGYKWQDGVFQYYINPIGVNNGVDYSALTPAIVEAISSWEDVSTSNIVTEYMGETNDTSWIGFGIDYKNGKNVVTWQTWAGYIIGQSATANGGGFATESDIRLNTNYSTDSKVDVLIKHEVGHSLGMGHTCESFDGCAPDEKAAVMFYAIQMPKEFNCQDWSGITGLYPADPSECWPPCQSLVVYHDCMDCVYCGDGILEGDELCDLNSKECGEISGYLPGGTAPCNEFCDDWDAEDCVSISGENPDDTDSTDGGGGGEGVDSNEDEWMKRTVCSCNSVGYSGVRHHLLSWILSLFNW